MRSGGNRREQLAPRGRSTDPTRRLPEAAAGTVLDALVRQVEDQPEHPALDDGTRRWGYGELWDRSGAIAAALAASGATTGTRVAVHGPRSAAYAAALVGVLRAGAVAVPLSTIQPAPRLRAMADTAGAAHLVALGAPPSWADGRHAVVLDDDARVAPASGTGAVPGEPAAPGTDAAVFFTSGTTGDPKAVRVPHLAIVDLAAWYAQAFAISPADRVSMVTNVGFVVTLRNLFAPLAAGATVCIAPDELLPEDGLAWVSTAGITVLHTTPTTARQWLRHAPTGAARPVLRWTLFGGEPLDDTLVGDWRDAVRGSRRVANVYGATEVGASRAWFEVPAEPAPGPQPIGRAIPGTELLVVDEQGARCATGQVGELLVRSRSIPDAYADANTGTAVADHDDGPYVANPFRRDRADRVCRTGDLALVGDDGELRLVGRADDQVKLGGFRIDLGDVASVLRGHAAVADAQVLAVTGPDGTPGLAAFVVPREPAGHPTTLQAGLRRHCAAHLPLRAVPTQIVLLDRMPTGATGKLDRTRLRALLDEVPAAPHDPRPDPTERLPEPPQVTLLDDIEAWVRRAPAHPAVDDGDVVLRYDELWARAGTIAEHLAGLGAGTDAPVLVTGPRGTAFAAAMLGVLRAGAVVVPCASMLPDARCAQMADEVAAAHVVCVGDVPAWARERRVLALDEHARPLDASLPRGVPAPCGAHAYVFFTSGTTGAPKAVLGRHASLAAYLRWWRETFDVGPSDRVSMATSTAFDVTLRNLFGPLVSGATACVAPDAMLPEDGLRWLADAQITVLHVTPSLAGSWLAEAPPDTTARALRWTLFAGEMLTDVLVRRWRATIPGAVANMYGPTETTMSRCLHVLGDEPVAGAQPVGFPLPGSQVLVVDERDRLCGVGEPGEVLVRTRAGTAGYANDAAAHAARFVTNPFTGDPDDVVYRTGDRGWYREDGSLQLAGRIDDQVKIGGVRVEPAEVTGALLAHDAVRDAHVQVRRGDGDDTPELVAFVVSDAPAGTDALVASLRRHLGALLAPAAIPTHFVRVERLPMTTNGKVDRAALLAVLDAAAAPVTPAAPAAPVTPRTPVALDDMVALWREVLRRDSVGPDTNFFDAGGSSVTAVRLGHRLREHVGRRVGLHDLLEAQTPRELTALLTPTSPAAAPTDATAPAPAHRVIAAHAVARPDACALDVDGVALPYAGLERRIRAAARVLVAHGVTPGSLVAIHATRTATLVPLLLAVHRAGAGYVPVDPELPAARLAFVLDDASAALVVTDRPLPAAAASHRTIALDELARAMDVADDPGAPDDDVVVADDPERVAYVIYTSGSTGNPKGVLVPQRALRAFVDAANARYGLRDTDRLLQYHSLSFDTSVEEIFCTLCAGATLVATRTPLLGSAGWFLEQLEAMRISVLDLPTAFWTGLTEDLDDGDLTLPTCVRAVIVGGSAARADTVNRFNRRTGGSVALFNAYGPTECTVAATAIDLSSHHYEPGALVTIGPAFDGVTTLVLDTADRPLGDDEPGELLLGGPQLALGYLNRPELTAERFVVDPTGATTDRYYRTGDRVRRRPDGSFVFEARVDDQVKIRGYRFELGEVEAALASHPAVREAVVLLEGGEGAEPRLVAHVVLRDGADASGDELRDHAATLLPAYAVPATIQRRASIPRTAGGKPDRRALRAGARAPLGFAQEMQWFLHKLEPESNAYNLSFALRVRGALDREVLDRALGALAERHESLRTRFLDEDGTPVQVIDEPSPVTVDTVVAELAAGEAVDDAARRILFGLSGVHFDLERGPLYRPVVVVLGEDDHLVVVRSHHIVIDGWSTDILIDELLALYGAGRDGRNAELAEPVQPRTLVAVERAAEADGSLDAAVARVAARLAPLGEPLALPLDRPRPAERDPIGRSVRAACVPGTADRLRDTARALRTTPFAVGAALFAEYLASRTAAADVVLGVPSADRDAPGSDRTVGMLVNTLAVRFVAHDGPVRDAIAEATRAVRVAVADKVAPFDRVVRALQPPRRAGTHPLFQVTFQVAPTAQPLGPVAGLDIEPFVSGRTGAKFDLSAVLVLGDEVECRVSYASDVFDDDTARDLTEGYAAFVAAALDDVDRALDDVRARLGLERPPLAPRATATVASPVPSPVPSTAAGPGAPGERAREVADVMARLLGREIGPDDDFFAVGGHSLLAVKLCSVIERTLGVRLGIASVFESPTPRALGVLLGDAPRPEGSAAHGTPLTAAQSRVWLQEQLDRGETQTYRELLGRRITGPLRADVLREAVTAVVARHEPLRSRVVLVDDAPVLVVDDPAPPVWRTVDRIGLAPGAGRDRAVEAELVALGQERLDLAHGPVLRCVLVQLADDDHALLVSVHHIVFDGPSADLFCGEVADAYDALAHGGAVSLAPLPTTWTRFARDQHERLARGDADASLAWWAGALAGLGPAPALPAGAGADRALAGVAHTLTIDVGREFDDAVASLARRLGTTRQRVGSALFVAFLHQVAGAEDVVLGLAVGERTEDALTPLIGFFVNTLPVRTRVGPHLSLEELVAQVHRATEDALAHRDAPFDRIVAALRAREGRVREPLLDTSFDYRRPMRTEVRDTGGVRMARIRKPDALANGAKFALDVTVDRVADGALVRFRYDCGRFGAADAAALAHTFVASARAALAAPDRPLGSLAPAAGPTAAPAPAVAPAGGPEDSLLDAVVAAFTEALGRPVDPDDDFFAAGGHSLLAVKLCSRLERGLGRRLAVATVFDHPTPRGVAHALAGIAPPAAPPAAQPAVAPATTAAAPTAPTAPAARAVDAPRLAPPAATPDVQPARPVRLHLRRAPLSFAQRRLWALEQLGEAGTAYVLTSAYDLHGTLDLDALADAMTTTALRHEALRTRYVVEDGEPEQVIDKQPRVAPELHDLRDELPAPSAADVDARMRDAARRGFDLAHEHPWRVVVARITEGHWVLAVSVHHIATDGESQGTILRDLVRAYNAAVRGDHEPLPTPALQYADHAVWQHARAAGGRLDASLEHWRGLLRPVPDPLRLPGARVTRGSGPGATTIVRGGAARLARVAAFARENRTTTFAVLLGAYELLLHELTGRTDLVVGIPATERTMDGDEDTVGFYVNTLPLRLQVDPAAPVLDLLRDAQRAVVDALANADAPFDLIVDHVGVPRDAAITPLVQTMFSTQDAAGSAPRFEGLLARRRSLGSDSTAKFDLSLIASIGDELDLWFEYRADVLDSFLVGEWAAQYLRVLDAILDAPATPVRDVPHLPPDTEAWLVEGCNRTRTAYPRERTVHELFAEVADAHAASVAVVDGGRSCTYAELRADADALAARLREAGVRPGDRVALELGRSLELVVATIAVLQSGAAYVPIDPTYPEARRCSMRALARVGATVALVDGTLAVLAGERGPTGDDATIADIDATSPAYVMFTSGSTGTPKGVVVPHRAIVRLVRDTDYVTFGPELVIAHLSNTSFDAATFEIWGALLHGARLVVLDTDTVTSPSGFADAIRVHGITTMFVTTALFNVMAREAPGSFATVRDVLFGGEAADPHAVRAVLAHRPPERLVNVYGPTESTTFASWHLVARLDDDATTVPIGRPIANTTLHVVDADGRPVPPFVEGELLIGGDGLALGYLDDEQMTATRFVPDPFSHEPGARLYRTGDVVRRRLDGAIEFVGRRDHQVKIRGFRIELGDVEASLRDLDGVDAAHVLARRSGDAGAELHAYVVAAPGRTLDGEALREALRADRPAYLVPAAVIVLDALPINANGKIDRDALPLPTARAADPAAPARARPVDALEEALTAIWAEVLERDDFGVEDNFFEVGGNSIRAVRVFAAIDRATGVRLGLSALFEAPTVRALAALVRAARPAPVATEAAATPRADESLFVTLRAGRPGRHVPVYFVHPAGGQVFAYAKLLPALDPDRTVIGIREFAWDAPARRLPTIEAYAELYADALDAHQPRGPVTLGGYSLGGLIAYEMARLLRARGRDVRQVLLLDATPRGAMAIAPAADEATGSKLRRRFARDGVAGVVGGVGRVLHRRWVRAWTWPREARRDRRALRKALRTVGDVDPILLGRISERAGHELRRVYRPSPYAGRVVFFNAIGTDPDFPIPSGSHTWNGFAEDFEIIDVPGNHANEGSMMTEPHVHVLARRLADVLDAAEGARR